MVALKDPMSKQFLEVSTQLFSSLVRYFEKNEKHFKIELFVFEKQGFLEYIDFCSNTYLPVRMLMTIIYRHILITGCKSGIKFRFELKKSITYVFVYISYVRTSYCATIFHI